MAELPYDLWAHVASHAHRTDLTSLALVSSVHLHASRPVLFRHLKLRMPRLHPFRTYIYLNEDEDEESVEQESVLKEDSRVALFTILKANGGQLARMVEKLDLDRDNSKSGPKYVKLDRRYTSQPIIPLDVLACMSNLRTLRISDCWPFYPDAYQLDFVNVINTHCPLLSLVEFLEPSEITIQIEAPFAIQGIKRVDMRCIHSGSGVWPFSFKPLRYLLHSSTSTLTHIIIPDSIFGEDTINAPQFTETHFFPVLDTFVIRIWMNDRGGGITPKIRASLAKFLYKHPTICNLTLGWLPPGRKPEVPYYALLWEAEMFSSPTIDPANFLPNLSSLEAHEMMTMFLARYARSCLSNLIELRTGAHSRDKSDPSPLFRYLAKEIGGIPTLKRLMYFQGRNKLTDLEKFKPFMGEMAAVFPALESWEGDLPSGTAIVTQSFLAEVFSKFSNLQHIQISSWGTLPEAPNTSGYGPPPSDLPEPDAAQLNEIARAVAEQCKNFKLLVSRPVYDASSKSLRTKVVTIKRGKEGGSFETRILVHEEERAKEDWWRRRRVCIDDDMRVYSEYNF